MTHRATSMVLSHAIIRVTNLRLRTYIGFNPEEQQKQQDVIINMEIHYPADKSFETDNVADALNYKTITKRVIQHVEKGRFQLLEKLVSELLEIVGEHPSVTLARVTVDKPHALRFADSVSLTLESRAKEGANRSRACSASDDSP